MIIFFRSLRIVQVFYGWAPGVVDSTSLTEKREPLEAIPKVTACPRRRRGDKRLGQCAPSRVRAGHDRDPGADR